MEKRRNSKDVLRYTNFKVHSQIKLKKLFLREILGFYGGDYD
jgi:hypothetical protein